MESAPVLKWRDRNIAMPKTVEIHFADGIDFMKQRRWTDALTSFDAALFINPRFVDAIYNRAGALVELRRAAEAILEYDKILAIKEDIAVVHIGRGNAFMRLQNFEEGIKCFERAAGLEPQSPVLLNYLGNALRAAGQHEEAAAVFAQVLQIEKHNKEALMNLMSANLQICDWTDYQKNAASLADYVEQGGAVNPFAFILLNHSVRRQLKCAHAFSQARFPPKPETMWNGKIYNHDRIRIAYLSNDFRVHATSHLAVGLFELHDRAKFEITALSFGSDDKSLLRERVRNAFDRFVDVSEMNDADVARLVTSLEIGIAVDLHGHTSGARTSVFAHRPAPIQVNYLGYPGTMGAAYIDYIIGDHFVTPEEHDDFYSEKIVRLPHTYQATDQKREIGKTPSSRSAVGLPEQGFVFCSFNDNRKITPDVFYVWMSLLRRVEGSVLWLLEKNATATANLRSHAELRGVAADRLVFAPKISSREHLARHTLADLCLDTAPYNGHTTTSDALWASVPVITCPGETFASRVAGSVLHAVGLPELVVDSWRAYEDLAYHFATTPNSSIELRQKLERNRTTYPLFDSGRFCRNIEAAYVGMWQQFQRGGPPESFAVDC